MTFDAIAYGPEEHLLVTFDGSALLAHDAHTEAPKWALTLAQPIAAVLYADLDTFPASQGNPWRSNASTRWLVAVDVTGTVHVIDVTLGQETSTLGPFGPPKAVAAGAGGRFALATADRVHVWRRGERTEIPDRAVALAFSNDGTSLALGGSDGSLRFINVATDAMPVETFCAVVHGGINDLVQHPSGVWVVAGRTGMFTVSNAGPQRMMSMPGTTSRVRFDARGAHLAVQLSERSVSVYTWPQLEVATRIEYIERPVRGLSFGSASWLGVALDHGDGNKIDIQTTATHRTDTHPGRTHRSWMLSVRGKEQILTPREANDVRRMKDPFHVPAPQKGNGGRVGLGVGFGAAMLGLRLVIAAVSAGHSSYTPPPYNPSALNTSGLDLYGSGTAGTVCDTTCASTRMSVLQVRCAEDEQCVSGTRQALSGLRAHDCGKARAGFGQIRHFGQDDGSNTTDVLDTITYTSAKTGLDQACGALASPPTSKHAMLVRLEGPTMTVSTEDLPRSNGYTAENAGRLLALPDGTLYATTIEGSFTGSSLLRRDPETALWSVVTHRRSTHVVEVAPRKQGVTFVDVDSMGVFDGTSKTELTAPSSLLFDVAAAGDDVLVLARTSAVDDSELTKALFKRRVVPNGAGAFAAGTAADWKVEPGPPGIQLMNLYTGGTTVWAVGEDPKATKGPTHLLFQRTSAGKWAERKWWGAGAAPNADVIDAVWVTPTNDAFIATEGGVFRSIAGGASFVKTPDPLGVVDSAHALWGRSSTDVFAATADGIVHFDGKNWARTTYRHNAEVLTGTKTDVYALTTSD